MKKISYLLLLLSVVFIIRCSDKKKNSFSINQLQEPMSELIKLALDKGDTIAYYKLRMDYYDSPYDGFLKTSLIMANKHNNKDAYMDVFYCLTDYFYMPEEQLLFNLDGTTKQMALEYLRLAADNEDLSALDLLSEYYNEGVHIAKDKELAKILKIKHDSINSARSAKSK